MFGRAPRGVSERPKKKESNKAIPSWLWLVVLILFGVCVVIFLSLWNPWHPVKKQNAPIATTVTEQDTNKDYRFYDLLPQQQVTPIPEQAVPQNQVEQPVVVVEAPPKPSDAEIVDPFDQTVQTAKIEAQPVYILQIRSYEDPDSADARRAEIILNGLASEVVISNEGQKIWYRVISGPYVNQQAARNAQQTLQNSGIDSIIVKMSQ